MAHKSTIMGHGKEATWIKWNFDGTQSLTRIHTEWVETYTAITQIHSHTYVVQYTFCACENYSVQIFFLPWWPVLMFFSQMCACRLQIWLMYVSSAHQQKNHLIWSDRFSSIMLFRPSPLFLCCHLQIFYQTYKHHLLHHTRNRFWSDGWWQRKKKLWQVPWQTQGNAIFCIVT